MGWFRWQRRDARGVLALSLAAILVACASSAGAPSTTGQNPSAQSPEPQRTLVIGSWGEPAGLASVPVRDSGNSVRAATRLFNAELQLQDAVGNAHPYLAEANPRLNTDTWQVFPDGRMETRYQLRPNLTWHDGTPLAAEDFVFAWQVYSTPEFATTSISIKQMEEVLAPDNRTVVIRWRSSYPEADALFETFQALPRHILGQYLRDGDHDGLVNHAYWTVEYVGLGPFKLVRWEPGSFIEGAAFDGHALGKPKSARVLIKLIAEESAIFTNVLAGEIHFAPKGLRFEDGKNLKRDWSSNQRGLVVFIPIQPRFIQVQLRPEVAQPRAMLDVRTRRAFAHAIDKKSLNETLFDGEPAGADTFLYRGVPDYAEIERSVTRYPYDLRQTEQLMAEVGYVKGSDGFYTSEAGERFSTEFWGDVGPQFELDHGAVSGGWRQAGLETRATYVAPAQLRDGQFRSSFKGMYFTATGTGTAPSLVLASTAAIPTVANRYNGSNRGGWSSPEFERLWEMHNTTLDRSERTRALAEIERLISTDLPFLMVFHNFHVVAYSANLKGPDTRGERDLMYWNVHEWELM